MDATSPRWRQVTPSQHAWEADALETLRVLLPDADPYYAWTNFEFTDGGRIHEADALVVTPKGVFLIEIKSWSGQVNGTQGTWVQHRRDGSRESFNNPASLNTAKVRSLASLIRRNWSRSATSPRSPFIQSLIWFSNPNLRVSLPTELRSQVALAEDNPNRQHLRTITEAIIDIGDAEAKSPNFERVTPQQADEFAATMARIGFKESTRTRTAGSYELQLPAFAERGSTQDFMAKHKLHGLQARVRIYSNVVGASPEEAKALKDAATREFMATQNLPLDGVVRAIDSDLTDFGPAVIFEHSPKAIRLDRFVAEYLDELDMPARLRIVEQLAGTVREMHRRRITHRMLTPESVWLRPVHGTTPGAAEWEPLVTDFSLAARETAATNTVATFTRVGSLPAARTGAVEVVLGDPAMESYLAPESTTDPTGADGVALDVFSLGALTFLLCTGEPPATSRDEMRTVLGSGGLSVAATMPDVDPTIESLVRSCTNPIVSERLGTMGEVADAIAVACASLRGDAVEGEVDPLVAGEGDVLGGRFTVKRRLGKGSTAVALWCFDATHDRDVVLKVALGGTSDDRLAAEAGALRDLKQANIVELYEELTIADRSTLVLSFAGDRSLAGYLRAEGSVSTEFLRRWGEDLLEAVRYLEKTGVAHRDVKPDNLGIVEMGKHRKSHLVLLDFSLANTPADDLLAGTPPYLDPFLADEGRGSFDLAAERYAAAVTIHEMATGETPTWGDGQSDPSFLPDDVEATLLIEAIDPEVREPVAGFLRTALRRNPSDRFDTADDMARAWLAAFADWEASDDDTSDGAATTAGEAPTVALPDTLTLEDPIGSLPTNRKVRSALRKLGAETIRGVAGLDAVSVNQARGVSVKTRKLILRLRAAVLDRFADELATSATAGHTSSTDSTSTDDSGVRPADDNRTGRDDTDAEQEPPAPVPSPQVAADQPRPDLDQLALALIPPRGKRGPAGSVAPTVRALLGLEAIDVNDDWPTVTAVARHMEVTPGAVSNSLQKGRAHWAGSAELMGVAVDLLELLAELGGVAGISELVDPLIDRRGSGNEQPAARRLSRAVIRAVLESGPPVADWFTIRRSGRRTIVAVNGAAIGDAAETSELLGTLDRDVAHRLAGFTATPLVDLAVTLGGRADELVGATTVVPSSDAVPALRTSSAGAANDLSDARLVRLAVAASDTAAVNHASDLVPLTPSPVDALRWSRTAIISAPRLTADELATRVAARFPGAALPERPELDDVITEAALPFEWSDEADAYVSTAEGPGGIGPLTVAAGRRGTVVSTGGTTIAPATPARPEIAEAQEIDERLERSLRHGGFLALRVPTDRLADARRGLARFQTGTPPMEHVDLEAQFLQQLRNVAEQRRIAWANLEGADSPDDPNWQRLSIVAGDAVDATVAKVIRHQRVIAWFPGALVRHAPLNQPSPLDRLRDEALSADSPLDTLWLVVLGPSTEALPTVDGTPVPALAANQWMDLTHTWLANDHRAGGLTA